MTLSVSSMLKFAHQYLTHKLHYEAEHIAHLFSPVVRNSFAFLTITEGKCQRYN